MTHYVIPTAIFEAARPNWRKDGRFYGYELEKGEGPGGIPSLYTSSDHDFNGMKATLESFGYTVETHELSSEDRAKLDNRLGDRRTSPDVLGVGVAGGGLKSFSPGAKTIRAMQQISTDTGFSIRFVDEGGALSDPVCEGAGDEIVVHVWSARRNPDLLPKFSKPRAKLGRVALCGQRWSRTERSFDPHGGCHASARDDNTVLAEALGRDVWVLHPLLGHAGDDKVMASALSQFDRHLRGLPQTPETRARIQAAALEMLLDVSHQDAGYLHNDRRSLENGARQLAEHEEKFRRVSTEIEESKRLIGLRDAEPDPTESFAAEIDRIRAMPKILRVSASSNGFAFITDELFCTHPKTKKVYKLGSMEISVQFGDRRSIQILNRTRQVNGGHHPHVRPSICWGNAAESVASLIEAGELATLALVVLGYLETCNPDDAWGRTIVEWPPAEEAKPEETAAAPPPATIPSIVVPTAGPAFHAIATTTYA